MSYTEYHPIVISAVDDRYLVLNGSVHECPSLRLRRGSEDINDKDYQTQYMYSWSKSGFRLRNINVY